MSCHVMSCHLMWWSRHLMRCDCLCCVMSRDAMPCHGNELLPVVNCNGMECYELKMPLVVRSRWWLQVVYSSTTLYYKVALMIDPWRIWNVIYNARSNKSQPPTSATTAPATKNKPLYWSASHRQPHWQWAEQQESASNFTNCCACHEILSSRLQRKLLKLLPPK